MSGVKLKILGLVNSFVNQFTQCTILLETRVYKRFIIAFFLVFLPKYLSYLVTF